MYVSLGPGEEVVIRAALDFANLAKIESAGDVEDLFRPLSGPYFQTIKGDRSSGRPYLQDQRELQDWLERILAGGRAARREIAKEVADRLGAVHARVSFDGRRLVYAFALSGVQASYAYGVALILDETRRGLIDRLRKCGYCERFFITFRGRRRKFCSTKHYREADKQSAKERIKRWRSQKAR